MQAVGESAHGFVLRFELRSAENQELRSLRGDDRNGGLLRVLQVVLEGFCETSEIAHQGGFGFFRAVGTQRANWRFVCLCHVRVGVPKPFDGTGALRERERDFAFEEGRFLLGSEAGGLIQIDFALELGLLNEHGHAGQLGFEEIAFDLPQARLRIADHTPRTSSRTAVVLTKSLCPLLVLALTVAMVLVARDQQESVPLRVDVRRWIRQQLLRARAANIS